jgi:N-acetylgalactosamine-6-sulfatase
VLTATGDGVTLNQTAVVTFTNGTPSAVSATQSKVWAFAAAVPADGTNQVTVLVTLKDVNDQAVSNKTVTLTRASGPGSPVITTIRGITDLYGVASFTVRSVTPGEVVFAATGDGVSLAPTAVVTFTANHNRLVPLAGGSNGSNTWWNFQLQGRPFGEFVLEQTPGLNPTAWQPGQAGMADDKGILRSTGLVSGATQFFRARAVPKPNFIFILMDDMSWGDVAAFAHPYAKTPNLDRLATSGTRFNQFYVCGNWCAPTRSSLMTGRLPEKAGIPPTQGLTGNRLNPTLPNVNQLLKTAGYATGHFGKWHLAHGFDQPDDWEHDEYGIDEWSLCYAESPGNGVPAHDALTASNTTAAALEFLDRHAGTPFHMNLWYVWPHVPVNPNAEQVAVYSNLTFNVSDFDPQMQAKYNQIQQLHPGYDMTANMKSYLATISECDKQIGKILDKLDAQGLTEDTLVVFSSDNGAVANNITTASSHSMWPASAGPYRGGKFEWYEGGIRMTCLARWPGRLPAGQTNDSLWRTVDWLPTVCALAGVKTGTLTLDGQNVADILLGNQRERTEPIFFGGAMREGRWKHAYGTLFDLQTDPSEQTNVAGIYPDQANSMSSLRSQWSANTLPTAIVNGEASPAWGGVVGGGAAYITGSNAVLVARPRSGWHFTAWNDGATNNPRTVVVPATNITFSANFEE